MTGIKLRGFKEPAGTIDMTPTWAGVWPIYAEAYSNGTTIEGRKAARLELTRMAELADKWVAHCQAQKKEQGE